MTLSGATWANSASPGLTCDEFTSQNLDGWTDGTSTLYIDQERNVVTLDFA